MTQTMIEQMSQHEYCHLLSYGDPITNELASISIDAYHNDSNSHKDGNASWISTLESTTYPDMTFGYIDEL